MNKNKFVVGEYYWLRDKSIVKILYVSYNLHEILVEGNSPILTKCGCYDSSRSLCRGCILNDFAQCVSPQYIGRKLNKLEKALYC